uniref:Uncharacterized protein n=1 Tax=Oryza brachyantha TaxID=4533 RepID=J3M3I1_ORYBR
MLTHHHIQAVRGGPTANLTTSGWISQYCCSSRVDARNVRSTTQSYTLYYFFLNAKIPTKQ